MEAIGNQLIVQSECGEKHSADEEQCAYSEMGRFGEVINVILSASIVQIVFSVIILSSCLHITHRPRT